MMNGAREYASYFKTGQYGRLYIVSGSHARGLTFKIFVLPEGESAISNGPNNAPLNSTAIEVYSVVGGQPGWTEYYGWIHEGKWQEDFYTMYEQRKRDKEEAEGSAEKERLRLARDRRDKEKQLLATYK